MSLHTTNSEYLLCQRLRMQLLAAQFRLRHSLERIGRLEANSLSFFQESEVLQAAKPQDEADANRVADVYAHASRQLEICRERLDHEQRYCLDAVAALHGVAIDAATQLPDDTTIAELVEKLIRLPLPTCPRPGAEVDSQLAITAWLDETVAAVPARIQSKYLAHVDALVEAVSAPSSPTVM